MNLLYFLGRIDGRALQIEIEIATAVDAETKKMSAEERKSLMESCGAQVEKRMKSRF